MRHDTTTTPASAPGVVAQRLDRRARRQAALPTLAAGRTARAGGRDCWCTPYGGNSVLSPDGEDTSRACFAELTASSTGRQT
jgi:hypothetical protein